MPVSVPLYPAKSHNIPDLSSSETSVAWHPAAKTQAQFICAVIGVMREANQCASAKDFVRRKQYNKKRICKACQKFELCTPSNKRVYENALKQGLFKPAPKAPAGGQGVKQKA
ncbi:MAG: hypothetical protein LBU06_01350 [Desulfovibrio sp.]|jgi:hypothetical protein|nr:hypothetical protein [Desulfovibrio sp.]